MAEGALTEGDTTLLRRQLARALRRQKLRAFLLVAPLFLFILGTFVYPIAGMLAQSLYAPEFAAAMPRTSAALADWNAADAPVPEAAYEALVLDLRESQQKGEAGKVATTMNAELPGTRSLIMKTARAADRIEAPFPEALAGIDRKWGNTGVWSVMQRLSHPLTARFYAAAIDREFDDHGRMVAKPETTRIYVPLFIRTLVISSLVTLFCLALGFPVAYWLSVLPARHANLLMILVLLPFWTSLLVRTTAWIVLLQNQGVINSLLVWLGVVPDDGRVQLIFNSTGTMIAMTHILLPFMILPLYSVMKGVPPSYVRAARSLGANAFTAFRRVYLPQVKAGITAGCLLVFILALGYYITPALVGGESGTLISNMIAYHIQKSLNWGLAAALSTLLLVGVLILYWAYHRLVQDDGLKLG